MLNNCVLLTKDLLQFHNIVGSAKQSEKQRHKQRKFW